MFEKVTSAWLEAKLWMLDFLMDDTPTYLAWKTRSITDVTGGNQPKVRHTFSVAVPDTTRVVDCECHDPDHAVLVDTFLEVWKKEREPSEENPQGKKSARVYGQADLRFTPCNNNTWRRRLSIALRYFITGTLAEGYQTPISIEKKQMMELLVPLLWLYVKERLVMEDLRRTGYMDVKSEIDGVAPQDVFPRVILTTTKEVDSTGDGKKTVITSEVPMVIDGEALFQYIYENWDHFIVSPDMETY